MVPAGSSAALQREGPWYESQPVVFLHDVYMYSLCTSGFSLGTLVSSKSLKSLTLR